MSDDLWGDLPEVQEIVHPRTILKEQAALLAERTQGVLHGEVRLHREKNSVYDADSRLDFTIICPSLQNYRYDVLSVHYRVVDIFPATIINLADPPAQAIAIKDIDEFKQAVKGILQSNRVRTAVAALLRDAEDNEE
jgi:hypothetical protein